MFKLISNKIITNDIRIPNQQDLTYKINKNTHQLSRYFYDGIWYDYNNWINTEYNIWMKNDYLSFIQIPS